ncbi:MAG: hypothetical protein ABI472_21945 [Ginsengibacter sp.]
MLRNHILICSILVLLAIPVYIADNNTLKSGGGNWISLDLRGMFIWSYLVFIGGHIAVSTLAVIYSHHFTLFKIHFYSAILSLAMLGIGLFLFDKIHKNSSDKKYHAKMEQRKSLFNNIQVKRWWFVPTAENPKEIHVDLEVTSAGRFAALAKGKENGETGKNIFSSDGEVQHVVKAGEYIHYVFPLTIVNAGQATNIEFTFYLFKAPIGTSSDDDVVKIFKDSIVTQDDGSYFYETLPPPLDEIPK